MPDPVSSLGGQTDGAAGPSAVDDGSGPASCGGRSPSADAVSPVSEDDSTGAGGAGGGGTDVHAPRTRDPATASATA
jgi:hypothetical protein